MKYVVINVYDREILKIGVADTLTEAAEIMKNDFMNIFLDIYEEEDFENGFDRGDGYDLFATEAWLNGRGCVNYDRRIFYGKNKTLW